MPIFHGTWSAVSVVQSQSGLIIFRGRIEPGEGDTPMPALDASENPAGAQIIMSVRQQSVPALASFLHAAGMETPKEGWADVLMQPDYSQEGGALELRSAGALDVLMREHLLGRETYIEASTIASKKHPEQKWLVWAGLALTDIVARSKLEGLPAVYVLGYEVGWSGSSSRPPYSSVAYAPQEVLLFKAGWADGTWDKSQNNAKGTSAEA